jgi:simple sugar transport system ATP-binding protein
LREISLRFGAVQALDAVDIDVRGGEVHAVLGENGAGKSTLMNVIYGLLRPERGRIEWRGRERRLNSPRDARRLGIGMVHQEFALIDALSVVENLALSLGDTTDRVLDRRKLGTRAAALAQEVGLELAPLDAMVGDLPVGARQRLEILKALAGDTQLLILDEPTAVLTPDEVEPLFAMLRRLVARGVAILFITHKLAEVMALADRMTVMRRGRVVGAGTRSEASPRSLAALMVGEQADAAAPRPTSPASQAPRLELVGIEADSEHGDGLRGIDLGVRGGEIVGLAGVDGNGQGALFELLCGLRAPGRGEIRVDARACRSLDATQLADAGIAAVPPDRRKRGAIAAMSVWENAILARPLLRRVSRGPFLCESRARDLAQTFVQQYAIVCDGVDAAAGSLSGGNLQKLIVARALAQQPRVLVAFNPTRGLDIAAARAVHAALAEAVRGGTAVLLISTDLDEVLDLSDRVAVLYRGRVSRPLARPFDRAHIGHLMAGAVA